MGKWNKKVIVTLEIDVESAMGDERTGGDISELTQDDANAAVKQFFSMINGAKGDEEHRLSGDILSNFKIQAFSGESK